jgi:hypothetical protein
LCAPYSRTGRIKPQDGFKTEWVFVCQKDFDRPAGSTRYDDVNLIIDNRSTRATCFFNSKVNEEPPTSEAGCVSGHAAQPWLRTPYLQQVKWGDVPVVPAMSKKYPYYEQMSTPGGQTNRGPLPHPKKLKTPPLGEN